MTNVLIEGLKDTEAVKAKVIDVAQKHGGRYVLPRRYRPDPLAPKSPIDYLYDACEALVNERKARWLPMGDSWQSGPGPGIELTTR